MDFNTEVDRLMSTASMPNTSTIIAMNEAGMDELARETMQVAKLANDHLNKIIDVMNETKMYFQCEVADELRKKFSDLSIYFPIIVHNIENYAYSIKKAKQIRLDSVDRAMYDLKQATLNVDGVIKNQ